MTEGFSAKKTAIDPGAVSAGLFNEPGNDGALNVDGAEPAGWPYGGHGGFPTVGFVEVEQLGDADVGSAIAVGEAEIFVTQVRADPFEATPSSPPAL